MNILIDKNPTSVNIDGVEHTINCDHITSIKFEMAIKDPELSEIDKLFVALNLYYEEDIPDNIEEAWNAILWFYTLGELDGKVDEGEGGSNINNSPPKPKEEEIYSFEHDGDYIFSSFLYAYKIDLSNEELHWWSFMKLFNTLPEDTIMKKIIEIRNTKITPSMSKEEKANWRKLKRMYKLPVNESLNNDNGEQFGDAISNLF